MFRRALNSYLIAVLLAGPCLCCCSLTRALTKTRTDASACQITAHSCCHGNTDQSSPEQPDRCPCRQHQDQQVISLTDGTVAVSDQIAAEHSCSTMECSVGSGNALIGATDPDHLIQQSLDSLYPTSRDRLRALSVMRC